MIRKSLWPALLILAILSYGCHREKKPATTAKGEPALISLDRLLEDPSTEIESQLAISAQKFKPYRGRGWKRSNGLISAVESPAILLLPDSPQNPQDVKLGFRAQGSNEELKILARGKEIASLTLAPGWHDYEFKLSQTNLKKPTNKLQFVFNGDKKNQKSFADFQNFYMPWYALSRSKLGREVRSALTLGANSTVAFRLKTSTGSAAIVFWNGIALSAWKGTRSNV